MCGIAGLVHLAGSGFVDQELLQAMGKILFHRGPDGYGIWKSDQYGVGLSHRRLSIIDTSNAGLQPMADREESVIIIFNGEIYNHQALRSELEKRGYHYRSHTDTETLLYAYKEWGISFLHKLEGMFAFVLFDIRKNELFLVRDRMGIKPLYFTLQEGVLSFASEIKALWTLPWMHKQVQPLSLYHCLTYMVTPAPLTLYQGVYKLPAGFYMRLTAQREISFHEWYNVYQAALQLPDAPYSDETFCKNQVISLLRSSVKKHMIADVPVGVFLSGGVDSSLNVALMSEVSSRVKTFNVVFQDDPDNDERQWARKIARHFNTEHHEIVISEKEAHNFFEKMVYHQDEPITDCVCVPIYYVSKLAKEAGVTVVQVGEGSDELFCGYSSYARYLDAYERYWKPSLRYIPGVVRKMTHTVASQIFPRKATRLDQLKNWAEGNHLFWSGAVAFPEGFKKLFLEKLPAVQPDSILEKIYPGMKQHYDSYAIVDYHLKRLKEMNQHASFLDSIIYLELKQRLPELLLMRVDKMAMATSIEGRVPFLDHHVVEFALRIDGNLKYKNGQTKYILKKACEDLLPHDVIYRKKIGFGAPTSLWFKRNSYFKHAYLSLVQRQASNVRVPFFNIPQLYNLLSEHQKLDHERSVQLWTIHNVIRALQGK